MKVKFEKVIGNLSEFFSEENIDKINRFTDYVEKGAEIVEKFLDKSNESLKKHTEKLCKMHYTKELDFNSLKEIIQENKKENTGFVVLLNLGRNANDKLEIFMQYLDKNKKAIDIEEVYCIRCKTISDDLEEAFGDKETLLIK